MAEIHVGDCRELLQLFAAESVDSIVTDPPYGLGFMGKEWDHEVPGVPFWAEMLRVTKPGAYMVAFGGTRTFHRMACAIEDAGWELRDTLMWVYGSGFPKSKNLSGDREGWGTALKPAWEPIILARKPLVGTVAANVLKHGTGALNIDGCRVSADGEANPSIARRQGAINHLSVRSAADSESAGRLESRQSPEAYRAERAGEALGRWPANMLHDGSEQVLAAFPQAKGQQGNLRETGLDRLSQGRFGDMPPPQAHDARVETGTSAARFFYCAKASKADREDGLSGFNTARLSKGGNVEWDNPYLRGATDRKNHHPTVKPTELMRWLCRLVTPPGGTILDPFTGSGSTGRGAVMEGFEFVGIELSAEYAAIAEARIRAAQPGLALGTPEAAA